MRKIIIYALLLLFLVTTVMAWDDGEILNQGDIDRIDTDRITRSVLDCQKVYTRNIEPAFRYSCQTIAEFNSTHYQVARAYYIREFRAFYVTDFLMRNTYEAIQNITTNLVNIHIDDSISNTKNQIRAYQTSREERAFRLWLYSFNPFN